MGEMKERGPLLRTKTRVRNPVVEISLVAFLLNFTSSCDMSKSPGDCDLRDVLKLAMLARRFVLDSRYEVGVKRLQSAW